MLRKEFLHKSETRNCAIRWNVYSQTWRIPQRVKISGKINAEHVPKRKSTDIKRRTYRYKKIRNCYIYL